MEKNTYKFLKYVLLLIIGIAIIYFLLKYKNDIRNISMEGLKNYILSYGKISIIIFILIYTLKPVVVIFPTWILSVLSGNIYGIYKGLVLNMFCCFTSATLGFYLARFLGKPFVDKILKGKTLKLNNGIEKHGFIIIILMRLSIVFPYDALSYGAGLTKIKYKDFILGNMIGILPEMVSYVLMGQNIKNPFSVKFILPIVLLVIVALISSYTYKKYSKKS